VGRPKILEVSGLTSLPAFYMTTMASTQGTDNPGQPREQLEVEEDGFSDENITYPTGLKLWLTMASLCIAYSLNGLVGFHDP
jgi:hypothetical protein